MDRVQVQTQKIEMIKIDSIARLTCMADNVDKKSLHCSSTRRSVVVTFTSSDTKEFISSTCK